MNNYPTKKVILGYTLLGGLVGSVIFVIIAQIMIFKDDGLFLLDDVRFISPIITFGTATGTVPALIIGTVLALTKTYLNDIKDGVKCLVVGFLVTFIFYFLLMLVILLDMKLFWKSINNPIFICSVMVGGLSSLILAVLLLPQRLEKKGE